MSIFTPSIFKSVSRKKILLTAAFLIFPNRSEADPTFVVSAGYGFIVNEPNPIEISEWVHLSFLDGLFNLWNGQGAWLGFSQGMLSIDPGSWYFEVQGKLYDIGSFPIGASYGNVYYGNGKSGKRGSIWFGAAYFIFIYGYEWGGQIPNGNGFGGLLIKVPFCLYGCSSFP